MQDHASPLPDIRILQIIHLINIIRFATSSSENQIESTTQIHQKGLNVF